MSSIPYNTKIFDYPLFRYPYEIINLASLELSEYPEVPAWIHNYHIGRLKALRYENRYLDQSTESKEQTPLFLKNRKLVSREASYITGCLKDFKNINFINLGTKGLYDSLDLITPILKQDRLSKYIMASQTEMINDQWINTAQRFASNYNIQLKVDSLEANFDIDCYSLEPSTIAPKNENTANLLFLGASILGQHIYPARLLKNIYDSMNSGDFLLVSQNIYRSSTEDLWVDNFINFLALEKHFGVEKEFARKLGSDDPIQVIWEEKDSFKGIKFRVQVEKPTKFGQVKFKKNQKLDIFRSARFTESEFKNIALDLDFKTIKIICGEDMDTALLFLQKN